MNIRFIIMELLYNVFEMASIFFFLNRLTLKKERNTIYVILYFIFIYLLLAYITFVKIPIFYQMIFVLVEVIIYLILFRKGQLLFKIFCGVFINTMLTSIYFSTELLVALIKNTYMVKTFAITDDFRILVLVISNNIKMSLFFIISRNRKMNYIPNKILKNLIILCISTCLIINLGFVNIEFIEEDLFNILVYSVISITISLIIIKLYFISLDEYGEKLNIENKLNINSNLYNYRVEVDKVNSEMRKIKHDYRNHIQVIYTLFKMNQLNKANEYIEYISDKFDIIPKTSYTDNEVIDAIIFNKEYICNQKKINIDIESCRIKEIAIEDYDICTLLGNLLDNAIEASMYLEEKNRQINVIVSNVKGCLCIRVSNNTTNNYKVKNGRFISIKKEKGHGIGISQIEHVVNKYSGNIFIGVENNKFTTDIVLVNNV